MFGAKSAFFFYYGVMGNEYSDAKRKAMEKVFERISETGEITDNQMFFLKSFKDSPNELDELSKAMRMIDTFLGIGGK